MGNQIKSEEAPQKKDELPSTKDFHDIKQTYGSYITLRDNFVYIYRIWKGPLNERMIESWCQDISKSCQRQQLDQFQILTILSSEFIKIQDHDLILIGKMISLSFKTLQKLKITISKSEDITNKGLENFTFSTIRSLKALQNLSLTFNNCSDGIDNKGLKILGTQINLYLPNLSTLHISFQYLKKVSNQGIVIFLSQICGLAKNLQSLELSFYGCKEITSEGISSGIYNLCKRLVNLEKLSISLPVCNKVGDLTIKQIGLLAGDHLWKLQELKLDFHSSMLITDEGLQDFGIKLKHEFAHLTKLILNFNMLNITFIANLNHFERCPNITDKGLTDLTISIQRRKNKLRTLNLYLKHCDKISIQAKQASLQKLKFIPTLVIF